VACKHVAARTVGLLEVVFVRLKVHPLSARQLAKILHRGKVSGG